MPILNTATSIVDFLKSQNKPSDFNSRKSIYDTSGLASAFGDYRGTPEQNTTLLKRLSTGNSGGIKPDIYSGPPGGVKDTRLDFGSQRFTDVGTQAISTSDPLYQGNGLKFPKPTGEIPSGGIANAQPELTKVPPQPTNANNNVYKDSNNNVFYNDGTPIDLATFKKMGLNIDHINIGSGPTPKDVIKDTTPSTIQTIYDLAKSDEEKAAETTNVESSMATAASAARASEGLQRDVNTLNRTAAENVLALTQKGQQLTSQTQEKFAAAGLFRSGKEKGAEAQIAQDVATKQASVQAKLGDQLYNTFSDFEKNYGTEFLSKLSIPEAESFSKLPVAVRGIVMQNYQDSIAKAQEKASKGALSTLEKLGYTVVGGQVIQTLAGRSAERAEESGVRAEERLGLAEAAGRRAEEAAQRAEQRFALETTQGNKSDREARLFDDISVAAGKDLEANKGGDNYVNADTYMKYRSQVKKSAPTKVDDFDKNFALRLNPADAIRLGINQAKYRTSSKIDSLIDALQSQ